MDLVKFEHLSLYGAFLEKVNILPQDMHNAPHLRKAGVGMAELIVINAIIQTFAVPGVQVVITAVYFLAPAVADHQPDSAAIVLYLESFIGLQRVIIRSNYIGNKQLFF
jgi:hypothetical protein